MLRFSEWGDTCDIKGTPEVHPDGLVHFYIVNGDWDGRYDPITKRGWSVMYPTSTFYMGDIL